MAPKHRLQRWQVYGGYGGYGGNGGNAVKFEATPAPEFLAAFALAVDKEAAPQPPRKLQHHFPIKEAAASPPVAIGTTDSTKPDRASSDANVDQISSTIKEAAASPPVAIGTTGSTKPDQAISDANVDQNVSAIKAAAAATESKIQASQAAAQAAEQRAKTAEVAAAAAKSKIQASQAAAQAAEQRAKTAEVAAAAAESKIQALQAAAQAAEQRANTAEAAATAAGSKIQAENKKTLAKLNSERFSEKLEADKAVAQSKQEVAQLQQQLGHSWNKAMKMELLTVKMANEMLQMIPLTQKRLPEAKPEPESESKRSSNSTFRRSLPERPFQQHFVLFKI